MFMWIRDALQIQWKYTETWIFVVLSGHGSQENISGIYLPHLRLHNNIGIGDALMQLYLISIITGVSTDGHAPV